MSSSTAITDRMMPTGTVTFLFTDIESSTTLAQSYPDEIDSILERHHAILRQSVEAHHGTVFRIIGDSFACAFFTVSDALRAAHDAQKGMQNETWRLTPIKVRMGIHTGSAETGAEMQLGDGYEGYLTLTRVQRIMSVAHGGQILLSSASAELVRGQLPAGMLLRDMGEHRLKGLVNPERLWQLVLPDLPSEFPPLMSFNFIPSNLPAQPTALIGRKAELDEIVKSLSSEGVRLLTLTGPGGIGKTRLAVQVAAELIAHFKDGIFFADLSPLRDPESVLTAIAQTLNLRDTSDRPLIEELKVQLRNKSILLLLDNFEQVTSSAPKVVELLWECPQMKILVTSREALHMRGEHVYPVPPLALPQANLKETSLEQLTQYEAVRLFIDRAQSVKPDFIVTNENAPAVAEICWRLDGLPLAIELAAARISLFSPQALLERLGSRMKLLRGGARDLPVRQQTLQDAIDWSYELLDSSEKQLFELLSVFSGGVTFEAVENVAEGIECPEKLDLDILDRLGSLVDKSLLRQTVPETGETRLLMLETIREFAAERLSQDPDFRASTRRAHAIYFSGFTQSRLERLTGDRREATLKELATDIDNIRSAWDYWVDESNPDELGKFVETLWVLFDTRGWYRSMIDLATDMLKVLSSLPSTPERVKQEILMQTSLARAFQFIKGYTPEVEQAYNRALTLSEEVGDIPELFPVLKGLNSLYGFINEFEKSKQMARKIISLGEHLNDPYIQAEGEMRLGYALAITGDIHNGMEHLERAISSHHLEQSGPTRFHLGNYAGVIGYNVSALFLLFMGFPERALKRANQGLELARRLKHPYSMNYAFFHLSVLYLWMDEMEEALECSRAALEIAREHEFRVWEAVANCVHGAALARLGQVEEGLSQIRSGMNSYQVLITPPVFWPMLLLMQAEVFGAAGKPEQGLAMLEEMLKSFDKINDDFFFGEACRIKGDLLMALSPGNKEEAETWYQRALEVGQKYQLRMLELRAAISLSRLWQGQVKAAQGKEILGNIYQSFTEGLNTAALTEARNLLETLA